MAYTAKGTIPYRHSDCTGDELSVYVNEEQTRIVIACAGTDANDKYHSVSVVLDKLEIHKLINVLQEFAKPAPVETWENIGSL